MFGSWNVNPVVGSMPQTVSTGFDDLFGTMLGATYTPLVYVGNQKVNGTNHAVLAEQALVTANGDKHIVLITLNESPKGEVSVVSIETVM